jgi:cell division transport system ATP-binding protein
VLVATHDSEMVNRMRRRVIELKRGRIVRDEATGRYGRRDETTDELGERLRRSET